MNTKLIQKNKKAFMLVELSVVIAVLAMLTAATFVTMQMIDQAHDRSVMQQLTKVHEACNIFYAQYGGLPGDLADASTAVKTGLTDGNGNGQIDHADGSSSYVQGESFHAWKHLNEAKTGISSYTILTAVGNLVAGTHGPKTKRNAMLGLVYSDNAQSEPAGASALNENVIMVFKPRNQNTNNRVDLTHADAIEGGLTTVSVKNILDKMDDGAPNTGNIIIANAKYEAKGSDKCVDSSVTANKGTICVLQFKLEN